MTYMFILKCALKLVLKNILYYDARSEKHHIEKNLCVKLDIYQETCSCVQFTFVALDINVLNGTKSMRSCLSLTKRTLVSRETQRFNTALQEPASLTNYFYNFPPQKKKKKEINKAFCCVGMKMSSVTAQSYRSFSSSEVYVCCT